MTRTSLRSRWVPTRRWISETGWSLFLAGGAAWTLVCLIASGGHGFQAIRDWEPKYTLATALLVVAAGFYNWNRHLMDTHRRVANLGVVHQMDETTLYARLQKELEERARDIASVYSTMVQKENDAMDGYRDYFNHLLECLVDRRNVVVQNLIRIAGEPESDPETLELFCNLLFKQALNKPSTLPRLVENYLTHDAPSYPFINFTLIDFTDRTSVVYYGWYTVQTSSRFAVLKKREVFAYSTNPVVCETFRSIFDISTEGIVPIRAEPTRNREWYVNQLGAFLRETR
ncbi:MAG: hypothetical protein ABI779_18535 [Acidobacteriota bacterium]